jgi:hypothetical protein
MQKNAFTGISEEQVKVVGHDDVSVQEIADAVVVDGFQEEVGVAFDLEKLAAVIGDCGDEVSAVPGGATRDRQAAILSVPQRLKPLFYCGFCGTAEAVPLTRRFELRSNDPTHAAPRLITPVWVTHNDWAAAVLQRLKPCP